MLGAGASGVALTPGLGTTKFGAGASLIDGAASMGFAYCAPASPPFSVNTRSATRVTRVIKPSVPSSRPPCISTELHGYPEYSSYSRGSLLLL
jgi:hypothetical protein